MDQRYLSFSQRYGYPFWLPWVFVLLVLGFCGFILTAFGTADWRWLAGAVVCWFLVAKIGD